VNTARDYQQVNLWVMLYRKIGLDGETATGDNQLAGLSDKKDVNIGFIIEPRCRRKHLERPRAEKNFRIA
jgi:hypothetical protein